MIGYLKIRDYILNLQNKVEQQKTDKQNLIEKLEKDIKECQENYNMNTDGFKNYWEGCIDTDEEILKIVKGENE